MVKMSVMTVSINADEFLTLLTIDEHHVPYF
jgi:hypothetical protein